MSCSKTADQKVRMRREREAEEDPEQREERLRKGRERAAQEDPEQKEGRLQKRRDTRKREKNLLLRQMEVSMHQLSEPQIIKRSHLCVWCMVATVHHPACVEMSLFFFRGNTDTPVAR